MRSDARWAAAGSAASCTLNGTRWAFLAVCSRGTGSSTFDYADYAERLSGAEVALVICLWFPDASYNATVLRFRKRFREVFEVGKAESGWGMGKTFRHSNYVASTVVPLLRGRRVTHVYAQGHGDRDATLEGQIRSMPPPRPLLAYHAVFSRNWSPWADSFATISEYVHGRNANEQLSVVNYIVRPAEDATPQGSIRAALNIPRDATVFCGYGGGGSFNIPWVQKIVCRLASGDGPDGMVFLFANIAAFCDAKATSPRLIHLPALRREQDKHKFIATCDAMLHARGEGETFGLAIAEFSAANKPVIASSNPTLGAFGGRAHLKILGERALLYSDPGSLTATLRGFNRTVAAAKDWNAHRQFAPEAVMPQFCIVFGGRT